ncbi:MAG: response regulator [Proteobacteria bacterium]|nr:response regulator [Pseudomonadota bacterium]
MKIEQPKRVVSWSLVVLAIVILWPITVLVLLIYFGNLLKDFLKDIHELSFKIGIVNFAAKKVQAEAVSTLKTSKAKAESTSSGKQIDTKHKVRAVKGSHILWVDDIPSNNIGGRKTFEQMGIQFTVSSSTEDALEKVHLDDYDAIISDMGRPPDNRAGYTLLRELQRKGMDIPFVIYSGSNLPEHKVEALRKGAVGATNNLPELVELVKKALLDA